MATTRKLQNTITWAKPFIKNHPLDISNMEPAVTIGNMVLGTIISPPFRWRFNRGVDSFPLVVGQCDYPRTLPGFASLEDQWVEDSAGAVHPLTGRVSLPLAPSKVQARPTEIAPQFEDPQSSVITLRTKERPNQAYTIGLNYQCKPRLLQSFGDLIGPLPDEYAYIFDWGFLTIASLLINDARFPIYEKFFIGKLLALQDGLSDQDVNIFLGNWQAMVRTQGRAQTATGIGNGARSS